MKAAIVYESLYGNTHAIADAIAEGLGGAADARVMTVEEAANTDPTATDLLVVGGPTHIHGMSLVDETNQLLPGELERAREWGRALGSAVSPPT